MPNFYGAINERIANTLTTRLSVSMYFVLYSRFFELKWESCYDQEHQINRTKYSPTDIRLDENYITVYITWMYLVFMYFIPFSTLAVFNLMTWLEMRRAIARRAQLSTQEQKEHNLATMLLVVVLVFFVCNLLPLVVNILELTRTPFIQPLANVSNFLVTINSSVNILIYCIFGKKFRTVFLKIFLGRDPPCILTSTRSQYHKNGRGLDTTMATTMTTLPSESMELLDKSNKKPPKSGRQITVRFETRPNGLNGSAEDLDRIIKVEESSSVGNTEIPELNGLITPDHTRAQVLSK